jgi:hypothetical protein
MSHATSRLDRHAWKQNQEALFSDSDFVYGRVFPLMPEVARRGRHQEWTVEIIRNKAGGRLTLQYSVGSCKPIFGKAYFDFAAAGEAYRTLTHLWREGFGADSNLEIPEPLGIIPEANLVLMRSADGATIGERAATAPIEIALADARLAAHWLVKYQGVRIPGLRTETPCEKLEVLKIADALAKVAAECSGHSALLIDMLHGLRSVAPKCSTSPPVAPMHGQFRPSHVFIEGSRATVIDIEKICMSDPAKDVARFCHALIKTCIEQGGDKKRFSRVAQEFVAEFRLHRESSLENLPYFSALLALKSFAKLLKSRKVDEARREAMCGVYLAEFEAWVQRATGSGIAA